MRLFIFAALFLFTQVWGGTFRKVMISPDMAYLYVYHKGKAVRIHRIQDTKNKLTGEYAKTYRPGQFIQPVRMDPKIQTIGEIELLHFLRDKVNTKRGVLIDVRPRSYYQKETIPGSVNIPYKAMLNPTKREKIIHAFGAKRKPDGTLDARHARDLAVYCHGLWCDKSSKFIRLLTEAGYPPDKIKYYRGGFQMWKILGFTTVAN